MNEEVKRIYKNIAAIYDGQPWHGDNIQRYLSDISAEVASKKPLNLNHSIAEIVCHMTAWRNFAIEKIKGNADYEVWDTELNWQTIAALTQEEWQLIKSNLQTSQTELLKQIEQLPEHLLNAQVEGRKYNLRLLLQGIAQHDVYHAGQIAIIKKLVR
jgi:uncharacterized damage-inducible protein DinB